MRWAIDALYVVLLLTVCVLLTLSVMYCLNVLFVLLVRAMHVYFVVFRLFLQGLMWKFERMMTPLLSGDSWCL